MINFMSIWDLQIHNLNPPLMPSQDVIDEVSLILTITGFKDKIEKIRASQEEE